MATLFDTAATTVARCFADPSMGRWIQRGTYRRVIPPTPEQGSSQVDVPVQVLLTQFNGHGPMADALWKPSDRLAIIQQAELEALGEPCEKDQLHLPGREPWQVLRGFELATGLLWHIHVRQ